MLRTERACASAAHAYGTASAAATLDAPSALLGTLLAITLPASPLAITSCTSSSPWEPARTLAEGASQAGAATSLTRTTPATVNATPGPVGSYILDTPSDPAPPVGITDVVVYHNFRYRDCQPAVPTAALTSTPLAVVASSGTGGPGVTGIRGTAATATIGTPSCAPTERTAWYF